MRSYRPSPFCSCGQCTCLALKNINETQMVDNTFKFLMGLNDSFEGIRGQILLLSPVPPLDKTFSMVLQEERQRQARIVTQPPPEMSALVASSSSSKRKFNSNIICEQCNRPGHAKANCYRLIGFPPDFKFTKSKSFDNKSKAPAHVFANNAQVANNTQEHVDQTVLVQGNPIDNTQLGLTPIQFQRLINYLNKEAVASSQPLQTNVGSKPGDEHHSNMAGFGISEDDWTS